MNVWLVLLVLVLVLVLVAVGAFAWMRLRKGAAVSTVNEAERLYNEGIIYRKGLGVDFDYVRARQLLLEAAEKGNIAAQYDVGMMLRQALGGPRDDASAWRWIERAAKSGDPRAALEMGRCCLSGDGVEKSEQNAVFWLREGANAGNAEAQYQLAMLYRDKNSSLWNSAKAASLMSKAAEKRYPAALFALSEMCERGEGVARDVKSADRWLVLAAEHGVPEAQFKLAKFYLTGAFGHAFPQDYRVAIEWFKRAGAHGVAEAQYEVGLRYERNEGVDEPDKMRAVDYFLKSAQMGYAPAQYRMGQLYQYGDTVVKSLDEARRWYQAAAAQGHSEAVAIEKKFRVRDTEQPFVEPAADSGQKDGEEDWKG